MRAFFGEDFINELEEIDSEFLQSGNKLLSLHSMDTTSLASALFLLSIAKNDVREEILNVFQSSLTDELPQAEATYFGSGRGRAGKIIFTSSRCWPATPSSSRYEDSSTRTSPATTPSTRCNASLSASPRSSRASW